MRKSNKGFGFLKIVGLMFLFLLLAVIILLSIRMIITKEDFFYPLKNKITEEKLEYEEDKKDEEEKYINELDNKVGVKCYSGKADIFKMNPSDLDKHTKLISTQINVYVENDKIIEISYKYNLKDFLKSVYEDNKDKIDQSGFKTYEEFSDGITEVLFSAFLDGFMESLTEKEEGVKIVYPGDESVVVGISGRQIDDFYSRFELDKNETIENILKELESMYEMKLKES